MSLLAARHIQPVPSLRIEATTNQPRSDFMNATRTTIFGLACACAAFGFNAQAASGASDDWHMTNGGTGFVGVTQSAGQPRHKMMMDKSAYMRSGEASTMMNGQPNVNPDAPMWNAKAMSAHERQTMGAQAAAASNPTWGTPD
jgi:hypothetical protein